MESDLFRRFPLLWPGSGVRISQDSDSAPGLNPLCRSSFFRESSSFAVCGRVKIEEIEGLRGIFPHFPPSLGDAARQDMVRYDARAATGLDAGATRGTTPLERAVTPPLPEPHLCLNRPSRGWRRPRRWSKARSQGPASPGPGAVAHHSAPSGQHACTAVLSQT